MRRSDFSPLDILGIILGAIVILVVVASIATLARSAALAGREWRSWPRVGSISTVGGGLTDEATAQYAGPFSRIELRNVAGDVTFTSTDAASVTVRSVKQAWSEAGLATVRVEIQERGTTLVIEEKHDTPSIGRSGTVAFDVAVPGSVREIDAKSVSGSIEVRGLPAGVAQRLDTVSGRIATDRSGDLHASTISGSVSFVFAGSRLVANSVSGAIHGSIEDLAKGGSVDAGSVSGSIVLQAWPGLDAEVTLRSLSGSMSCDFPLSLTTRSNNRLQGRIGTGAASLDAHTASGSISIVKR
jgi:DUF4097 and DUF4098 domain-containing protein YvlB